ncbi:MAG: glycosyltransferase family 39 protein [Anaerolineaceae bacterium]|nr:glycosyltransferase family 39 protein [Anaerolineaceae bacterium]
MPARRSIYVGLMTIATVVLLFALVVYLAYAVNLFQFPYDYDQGEGFELVDTIMFSQFQWPYQNTDIYPFYSSNYPPLFHIIPAPLVAMFGPQYWTGRVLSFIGTFITATLIAYAVYRDGNRRWIASLCGLAFLSSNMIYHNGPLFRQHLTMVMFETVAVLILAKAIPRKNTKQIAIGFLILVLAGYTKQLAAVTALAVLAWMFLRNPRRAFLWGLFFASIGVVIFVGLNIATNGEWWRQAILANINKFDPLQAFGLAKLWLQLHFALIIPAVLFALYELFIGRLSLYSVWLMAATVLGALGAGTWGAGDSYYGTSIAAMCIAAGIALSSLFGHDDALPASIYVQRFGTLFQPIWTFIKTSAAVLVPTLFVIYGISTFKMPTEGALFDTIADTFGLQPNVRGRHFDTASYDVVGYANIGHFTTQADIEAGNQIVELIRATDGPVISEDAGFVLAAGRPVITNPTQLRNLSLNNTDENPIWDGTELIQMVENKQVALIILRASFFPTPFLEAVLENYSPDEAIEMNGFTYQFWRPQPD